MHGTDSRTGRQTDMLAMLTHYMSKLIHIRCTAYILEAKWFDVNAKTWNLNVNCSQLVHHCKHVTAVYKVYKAALCTETKSRLKFRYRKQSSALTAHLNQQHLKLYTSGRQVWDNHQYRPFGYELKLGVRRSGGCRAWTIQWTACMTQHITHLSCHHNSTLSSGQ